MEVSSSKLQQLVTVARTGSFSKAAIELNISQPALSRSIAAIEDRYGFEIFIRLGRGVQTTAAGAQVIALAKPLLQSMSTFDNSLKLFGSGDAGSLAIGLAPLLASHMLTQFTCDFFGPDSKAELRIAIHSGAVLANSLKSDAIEMFFFPEGYIEPDVQIEVEPVGNIIPACVVRSDHPLAKHKNLNLEDLTDYTWANSVAPPVVEETLNPRQFICDNYHILREVVLKTDLICICSSSFVSQQLAEGTLTQIHVEGLPLPATTIYSAKLRGRVCSPLAENAVTRIRSILKTP